MALTPWRGTDKYKGSWDIADEEGWAVGMQRRGA